MEKRHKQEVRRKTATALRSMMRFRCSRAFFQLIPILLFSATGILLQIETNAPAIGTPAGLAVSVGQQRQAQVRTACVVGMGREEKRSVWEPLGLMAYKSLFHCATPLIFPRHLLPLLLGLAEHEPLSQADPRCIHRRGRGQWRRTAARGAAAQEGAVCWLRRQYCNTPLPIVAQLKLHCASNDVDVLQAQTTTLKRPADTVPPAGSTGAGNPAKRQARQTAAGGVPGQVRLRK